jgi:hypothetical protein
VPRLTSLASNSCSVRFSLKNSIRNILNALIVVILRHLATISCKPAPPLPRLERAARVWLATLLAPRDLFLLWSEQLRRPRSWRIRERLLLQDEKAKGFVTRENTARNSTIRAHLGERLRAYYGSIECRPPPDRLAELIERLTQRLEEQSSKADPVGS